MRIPRHAEIWSIAAAAGLAAFGWVLIRGNPDLSPDARRIGARARTDPAPSDPDDLEAWLRRNPSVARQWLELGNKRMDQGRPDHARAAWLTAETLYEEHARREFRDSRSPATSWYNFACVRARLGRHDDAIAALQRAADAGWMNAEHALTDPDLESLRHDPRFIALMEKLNDPGRARIYDAG